MTTGGRRFLGSKAILTLPFLWCPMSNSEILAADLSCHVIYLLFLPEIAGFERKITQIGEIRTDSQMVGNGGGQ